MASKKPKKKTSSKKRKKPVRKGRPPKKIPFWRRPLFLAATAIILLFLLTLFFFRMCQQEPSKPSVQTLSSKHKQKPEFLYEEPVSQEEDEVDPSAVIIKPTDKTAVTLPEIVPESVDKHVVIQEDHAEKPLVAIVIDDMGHDRRIGKKLIQLDLALSFSFLPYTEHATSLSQYAHKHGRDILLHLPMEPSQSKWNPGPDALMLHMSENELRKTIRKNIIALPLATGVNNHMGSRFTENFDAMHILLNEVKKHKLYFLDSVTSSYSVGYSLARKIGIKTARRNVFLDNVQDKELIKKQLDKLIVAAKKNGQAVGIAHPHKATFDALREYEKILQNEISVVGIGKLIK